MDRGQGGGRSNSGWWPRGHIIGYEHTFIHQAADFLTAAGAGGNAAPTFRDALRTDYVTDAVLKSAANRSWVEVSQPLETK